MISTLVGTVLFPWCVLPQYSLGTEMWCGLRKGKQSRKLLQTNQCNGQKKIFLASSMIWILCVANMVDANIWITGDLKFEKLNVKIPGSGHLRVTRSTVKPTEDWVEKTLSSHFYNLSRKDNHHLFSVLKIFSSWNAPIHEANFFWLLADLLHIIFFSNLPTGLTCILT